MLFSASLLLLFCGDSCTFLYLPSLGQQPFMFTNWRLLQLPALLEYFFKINFPSSCLTHVTWLGSSWRQRMRGVWLHWNLKWAWPSLHLTEEFCCLVHSLANYRHHLNIQRLTKPPFSHGFSQVAHCLRFFFKSTWLKEQTLAFLCIFLQLL